MKQIIPAILTATLLFPHSALYAAKNNTSQTAVSPAERTKIEEVVHHYLLQKPEVLVEALQILQRKQYEATEKTIKETQQVAGQFANPLFHQANDPIAGEVNGPITIVEFFDYQCPHCVDMGPIMDRIMKDNTSVRVVFKEFPIRGPLSEQAARAALAANMQGHYFAFHRALLASTPPLTAELIFKTAETAGLDVEKLKTDMNSKAVSQQLEENKKLGQALKLFGTPAFFIGKTNTKDSIRYIAGQMDQAQMQNVIDRVSKD